MAVASGSRWCSKNEPMSAGSTSRSSTSGRVTSSPSAEAAHAQVPRLDARLRQHLERLPRILCEARAHGVRVVGLDDYQRPPALAHRSAEQDQPIVDEAVHEFGVLAPELLLRELARPVPTRAALARDDEVLPYDAAP